MTSPYELSSWGFSLYVVLQIESGLESLDWAERPNAHAMIHLLERDYMMYKDRGAE